MTGDYSGTHPHSPLLETLKHNEGIHYRGALSPLAALSLFTVHPLQEFMRGAMR